jgi:hypothetical protein
MRARKGGWTDNGRVRRGVVGFEMGGEGGQEGGVANLNVIGVVMVVVGGGTETGTTKGREIPGERQVAGDMGFLRKKGRERGRYQGGRARL